MRPVQDVDVLTEPSATVNRSLRRALLTAGLVVVADQLTKLWAVRTLGLGPCGADPDNCIDLFWTLRFNLVENPGAAFSTGTSLGPLFALIALVMTVVLFNVARKRTDRWGPILLGLIGGGAVGNLIDRMVRADDGIASGKVIDFVDFQWWPVFNVADMGVVMGVIVFVVYSMFETEHPPLQPGVGEAERPEHEYSDLERPEAESEYPEGSDSTADPDAGD
ncbi:MAG: signal peptidase II [Actinomycetota bacterium]